VAMKQLSTKLATTSLNGVVRTVARAYKAYAISAWREHVVATVALRELSSQSVVARKEGMLKGATFVHWQSFVAESRLWQRARVHARNSMVQRNRLYQGLALNSWRETVTGQLVLGELESLAGHRAQIAQRMAGTKARHTKNTVLRQGFGVWHEGHSLERARRHRGAQLERTLWWVLCMWGRDQLRQGFAGWKVYMLQVQGHSQRAAAQHSMQGHSDIVQHTTMLETRLAALRVSLEGARRVQARMSGRVAASLVAGHFRIWLDAMVISARQNQLASVAWLLQERTRVARGFEMWRGNAALGAKLRRAIATERHMFEGQLDIMQAELDAANSGLDNVRPQLERARQRAYVHLLAERMGAHVQAWLSTTKAWAFEHWKCMVQVAETLRDLQETIHQSQEVLRQIVQNPVIVKQLQEGSHTLQQGSQQGSQQGYAEVEWFKQLARESIEHSKGANQRPRSQQPSTEDAEEATFLQAVSTCAAEQRHFVANAHSRAEASFDFLSNAKNVAILQQVHSRRMAEHKALLAKDRSRRAGQRSQNTASSLAVSQVLDQAWKSEYLANPKLEAPAHLEEALISAQKHQTQIGSLEAKCQLEKWMTAHLFST